MSLEDTVTRVIHSNFGKLALALNELEKFDIVVGIQGQQALAKVRRRVAARGKRGKNKRSRVITTNMRVVELATIHEFGSKKAHIPERSFLRATVRMHQKQIKLMMRNAAKVAMQGGDPRVEAEKIALRMEAATKRTLTLLREPPLALSTIARRKRLTGDSDPNPLIDTGQLRQSITGSVRDKTVLRRIWARLMRGR